MEYLVDDLAEGGFGISYVAADKGYDAEYVHVNIWERLHAKTMIPIRKMTKPSEGSSTKKAGGSNRGRMRHHFDEKAYSKRSWVETVNSMIKRKMGDTVYGRTKASRPQGTRRSCSDA